MRLWFLRVVVCCAVASASTRSRHTREGYEGAFKPVSCARATRTSPRSPQQYKHPPQGKTLNPSVHVQSAATGSAVLLCAPSPRWPQRAARGPPSTAPRAARRGPGEALVGRSGCAPSSSPVPHAEPAGRNPERISTLSSNTKDGRQRRRTAAAASTAVGAPPNRGQLLPTPSVCTKRPGTNFRARIPRGLRVRQGHQLGTDLTRRSEGSTAPKDAWSQPLPCLYAQVMSRRRVGSVHKHSTITTPARAKRVAEGQRTLRSSAWERDSVDTFRREDELGRRLRCPRRNARRVQDPLCVFS